MAEFEVASRFVRDLLKKMEDPTEKFLNLRVVSSRLVMRSLELLVSTRDPLVLHDFLVKS